MVSIILQSVEVREIGRKLLIKLEFPFLYSGIIDTYFQSMDKEDNLEDDVKN